MSPGSRPNQPLPMPAHNNIPMSVMTTPTITRNFPMSFISQTLSK